MLKIDGVGPAEEVRGRGPWKLNLHPVTQVVYIQQRNRWCMSAMLSFCR